VRPGVASAPPHPALARHVQRLWGVCSTGAPERRRESPVPGTALVLSLEHGWRIGATEDAPLQPMSSFAGGLSLAPAVSEHDGRIHCLQVNLSPLGTAAVLRVPGAALAGQVVALGDLVGDRAAAQLAEQLAELDGWPERFAALQAWMARRVVAATPVPRDVAWAVGRLDAAGGRVPIAELQRELGCSPRRLTTRFREHVGCGPKAYARLVRFGLAEAALRRGEDNVARIAAACGYSDQAHLAREVRAFAGTTPGRMQAQAAPVTFLQDGSVTRA
jgi:AraC-like DNA-binding protein